MRRCFESLRASPRTSQDLTIPAGHAMSSEVRPPRRPTAAPRQESAGNGGIFQINDHNEASQNPLGSAWGSGARVPRAPPAGAAIMPRIILWILLKII